MPDLSAPWPLSTPADLGTSSQDPDVIAHSRQAFKSEWRSVLTHALSILQETEDRQDIGVRDIKADDRLMEKLETMVKKLETLSLIPGQSSGRRG